MSSNLLRFNLPSITEREWAYVRQSLESRHLSGDGGFTHQVHAWLKDNTRSAHALFVHSCTAALEMSALLCNLKPGDEVIMPSFTFVSTANAVVLRGAQPVFVDIRPDTLNIDENKIEAAITPKTKAIFVVHYAGVACEMDSILALAERHKLKVVEDAAQGLMAKYKGRALGAMGDFGCLSFHETKNLVSGEGGALLVRHEELALRAEILREKGTNRSQFFRGQVDKYTWVDVGSSYLPSDLLAALLMAQLERAQEITQQRLKVWEIYHREFISLERHGVRRPFVPSNCEHNAHMYYLITNSLEERTHLIQFLKDLKIQAPFHYVPLHTSPAGRRFSRAHGQLTQTEQLSDRLVRLPLHAELRAEDQARITQAVHDFYQKTFPS